MPPKRGFGTVTLESFTNVHVDGPVPTPTGFCQRLAPLQLKFSNLGVQGQQRLILLALALQAAQFCKMQGGTEAAVVASAHWLMPFLSVLAPQLSLTLQPSAIEAAEASFHAAGTPSPKSSGNRRRSPPEEQSRLPLPPALPQQQQQQQCVDQPSSPGSPSRDARYWMNLLFSPEEYLKLDDARGHFDLLMRVIQGDIDAIRGVIEFKANLLTDLPRYLEQAAVQGVAALMQNITRGWCEPVHVALTDGNHLAVVRCVPTWDKPQQEFFLKKKAADIEHGDVRAKLTWVYWAVPFNNFQPHAGQRDAPHFWTGLQVLTLMALPELREYSASDLQAQLKRSAQLSGKDLYYVLHPLGFREVEGVAALQTALRGGHTTAAAALHAVLHTPLGQDMWVVESDAAAAAQGEPAKALTEGQGDAPAGEPAAKRQKLDAEDMADRMEAQAQKIKELKAELAEKTALLRDFQALAQRTGQALG